jgi:hypothetical protein
MRAFVWAALVWTLTSCVAAAQGTTPQINEECSRQADARGLSGQERVDFRRNCKAGSAPAAAASPGQQLPTGQKRAKTRNPESAGADDVRPECARKWLAHKAATNASQDEFSTFFKKCISDASGVSQERSLDPVSATLARINTEVGKNLETEEGRNFISPLIGVYKRRGGCERYFEYTGGKIVARSIEGNVGIVIVEIYAVSKYNTAETEIGSAVANQCGYSSQKMGPGGVLRMELKGQFRKYDTGWRLEGLI